MSVSWKLGLFFVCFSVGCGSELMDGEDDGAEEAFLFSGKADTGGIEENSAKAHAVLKVANEASLATLDDPVWAGGVGLTKRAAQNIVAYRLGDDELSGTSDDEVFENLAELDAIPYVGPTAFAKILAFAEAQGYLEEEEKVDPLDENICSGAFRLPTTGPLRFAAGEKKQYTRSCNAFGECTPWAPKDQLIHSTSDYNGYNSNMLNTDSSVALSLQIGSSSSSQSGSSTYICSTHDIGSANLDPTTGIGTGNMQSGYTCNIQGGSGGPYGTDPRRPVRMRLGTTCLAVADVEPAAGYGTQTRSLIILTW